jgi:hypothetical protein
MPSCEHLGPPPVVQDVPSELREYFTLCSEGDGGFSLLLEKNQSPLFQGHLDYVVSKEKLTFEIENPFSQTVFGVRMGERTLAHYGPFGKKLSPQIDENGFLMVKDQWTPLRKKDLACLLGFAFPKEWLDSLTRVRPVLTLVDKDRRILIQKESPETLCARFRWSRYWGLVSQELKWCFVLGTPKKIQISLKNTPFSLNLVADHE